MRERRHDFLAVAANPSGHGVAADLLGLRAVRIDLLGAKIDTGVRTPKGEDEVGVADDGAAAAHRELSPA